MSFLSSLTGIHISPQHGVHIEPLKALGTVAGIAGLGPLGGLLGSLPGAGAVAGAAKAIPGVSAIGGALSKAGPAVQGIESFLGGNGGRNALGLAEAGNAAMLQSRQNDLAKGALATSQQSYGERQPLRAAGIQGMLNPGAGIQPRIAALTAGSSNPFQRPMPPSPAIQGVG